eukprot:1126329-Rhodomonas_salina.1
MISDPLSSSLAMISDPLPHSSAGQSHQLANEGSRALSVPSAAAWAPEMCCAALTQRVWQEGAQHGLVINPVSAPADPAPPPILPPVAKPRGRPRS